MSEVQLTLLDNGLGDAAWCTCIYACMYITVYIYIYIYIYMMYTISAVAFYVGPSMAIYVIHSSKLAK